MVVLVQAVQRLDAEVAALKSAAALAKHAAAVQMDKAVNAHEQQVLALQAANNKLQLELADLAHAVPTMLRCCPSTQALQSAFTLPWLLLLNRKAVLHCRVQQ